MILDDKKETVKDALVLSFNVSLDDVLSNQSQYNENSQNHNSSMLVARKIGLPEVRVTRFCDCVTRRSGRICLE